jgi:site-specific DNA-methyltransferase (adenine-specific)
MTKLPTINFHLADCMEFMRGIPDGYYDLAIVDPPYGIGAGMMNLGKGGGIAESKNYIKKDWDNSAPLEDYFNELFRVSKNQIICGGNYFKLPVSKGWIVWQKFIDLSIKNDYSPFELLWSSFKTASIFVFLWNGFWQGDMARKEHRIHPTQKPVALYKWLLTNYAKPGHRILDTHGGSMSSAIACHDLGFDLDIIELDPDYFKAGTERFNRHVERWHKGMAAPIHDPTDYSNLGGIFSPAPNDCEL